MKMRFFKVWFFIGIWRTGNPQHMTRFVSEKESSSVTLEYPALKVWEFDVEYFLMAGVRGLDCNGK